MLSPDQAFNQILYRFPQAQATVALRRHQIVGPLASCLSTNRFVVYLPADYSVLVPNIQSVVTLNLQDEGIKSLANPFPPAEDLVTIQRAKYNGRYRAQSCKITNVFTVNQRKLWETLGWSAIGVLNPLK